MIQLETERLWLRPFQPGDWREILAYRSNSEVWTYLPFTPDDETTVKNFVLLCFEKLKADVLPDHLAIVLKDGGQLIGDISLRPVSQRHRTRELGFMLSPAFHSQGYTKEACEALLRYAFETWKVHRVIASCDPRNTASSRVLEYFGMRREGYFTHSLFINGTWHDECQYAILAEEWNALHF